MKMQLLKSFVKKNILVVMVLLVALFLGLWNAVEMTKNLIYFNDPKHQNEPLKPWMTLHYVGMSYDVPRPVLITGLALQHTSKNKRNMKKIAAAKGLSLLELTEQVRLIAAAHHNKPHSNKDHGKKHND